jgi:hypothetical protein
VVFKARDTLKAMLVRDEVAFDASSEGESKVMIAQYNELYSLPWDRDNEVWFPVTWPV